MYYELDYSLVILFLRYKMTALLTQGNIRRSRA